MRADPAGVGTVRKITDSYGRRRFLKTLLMAGIGGPAAVPALIRNAIAMGALKYPNASKSRR
ncbi:MAG: hypothetical protein JEZ11_20800 [Desulfobacterales bacterium]|nr:hypothetical protein [Desulfobacterales bacterium]